MEYTIDYFIEKFEAIPDLLWTTGDTRNMHGQCCAIGHCGVKDDLLHLNEEALALADILEPVYRLNYPGVVYNGNDRSEIIWSINDSIRNFGKYGRTPKERILSALRKAKELQLVIN